MLESQSAIWLKCFSWIYFKMPPPLHQWQLIMRRLKSPTGTTFSLTFLVICPHICSSMSCWLLRALSILTAFLILCSIHMAWLKTLLEHAPSLPHSQLQCHFLFCISSRLTPSHLKIPCPGMMSCQNCPSFNLLSATAKMSYFHALINNPLSCIWQVRLFLIRTVSVYPSNLSPCLVIILSALCTGLSFPSMCACTFSPRCTDSLSPHCKICLPS